MLPSSMTWFVLASVVLVLAVASYWVMGVAVYNTLALMLGIVFLVFSIIMGEVESRGGGQ